MSWNYPLALGLLFATGFLELSFNSMAQSLVQINAPLDNRGRVIGLFGMASLGLRAFSGVTVGLLGSLIGVHWSLAAVGAGHAGDGGGAAGAAVALRFRRAVQLSGCAATRPRNAARSFGGRPSSQRSVLGFPIRPCSA